MTKKWKTTAGISGNKVLQGDGFYISYMPPGGLSVIGMFDSDASGDETALCKDGNYLILNGDFRKQYEGLVDKGYQECLKFYQSNKNNRSSWSEDDAA